ncbi:MAG TPA: hypothetical protein PLD46_01065 [Hyphomicrobium sp.]|nr:hypothetical protein [Hyphomicrobium sp.]
MLIAAACCDWRRSVVWQRMSRNTLSDATHPFRMTKTFTITSP